MNDIPQQDAGDALSAVAALVNAWKLQHDSPDTKLEDQIVNPYPGLRAFDPAESLLYFGRRGEDATLARRLESHNVVGVLGGSGSGKSSLVLAGLLPYLKRFQRIPGRGGRWYLARMRPGQAPVKALIEALWEFVCAPLFTQEFGSRALRETFGPLGVAELPDEADYASACKAALTGFLTSGDGTLDHDKLIRFANEGLQTLDAAANGGLQVGPANLLIVIDQFEELFRDKVDQAGAGAIVELVKKVHGLRERQGLFITLTMRSEEMHRCAEHEGLSDVIFASSVQIELLTKTADLRSVIIEPARRAFGSWGISYDRSSPTSPVEPDLVDFLVTQTQELSRTLAHKPDSLPLLQHALRVIWNSAVERWQRLTEDSSPTLSKDDFAWYGKESPFRACLDGCADKTRAEAVAVVTAKLGGDPASATTAANHLIDIAFASLARMDDNNRWVRSFASAAHIAKASIIEVAEDDSAAATTRHAIGRTLARDFRSLLGLLGLTLPARYKEIFQTTDEQDAKKDVVTAALNTFRRAGYLFENGGVYDVSHEALIRSWKYYQDLLKQARQTRDALYKADAELIRRAGEPRPNWASRMQNWWRGGRSRQAWEALHGINIVDLAKLFVPPRWLGKSWADAQLSMTPQPGATSSDRLARIEETYRLARRWKERDGLKPPREMTRRMLVSVLPLPVIAAVWLPWSMLKAEQQLREMLTYSGGLSQDDIERDPVKARRQLDLALIAGKKIATRPWNQNLASYIFGRGPVEETAFQILDQKSRTVFRYMPGRIADTPIPLPTSELSDVSCSRADKSGKEILSIAGLPLKYYAKLKGYSFLSPKPDQDDVPYMLFEQDDIVCASKNGELLLRIQPVSVIVHSLTLIAKTDGSSSLNIVGSPTVVAFYDATSTEAEGKFGRDVATYIWTSALNGGIKYFKGQSDPYKNVQAFVIPYQGKSIHIVNIAGGSYQPYVMEKTDCGTYFKECSPAPASATYGTRRFDNLKIEERPHTLEVSGVVPTQTDCKSDNEFCPQRLVLRRLGSATPVGRPAAAPALNSPKSSDQAATQAMPEVQKTNRMNLIYVGLPIVDAVADDRGRIILLDSAGNVLQYLVGSNAFSDSIMRAGPLFYSE